MKFVYIILIVFGFLLGIVLPGISEEEIINAIENDFVPYSGATDNLDMGNYNITANSGEIANLSITENSTTVIINSVGGKDICIGNC